MGSKVARNLSKPELTNALWSAGFSFSKCHAELKVPVDRHAPNVFSGEQINRAARFWTYGYDIYTPNRIIIAHDYERSRKNPAAFSWRRDDANWTSTLAASHVHLKTLLGMPLPGEEIVKDEVNLARLRRSKFGLGDRRSLEQLVQFSGIDFSHEKYPLDGFHLRNTQRELNTFPSLMKKQRIPLTFLTKPAFGSSTVLSISRMTDQGERDQNWVEVLIRLMVEPLRATCGIPMPARSNRITVFESYRFLSS